MVSVLYEDICVLMKWTEENDEFQIDKGWIAGAFFLGLFVGGGIAALLIPCLLKGWEKKKRQDEEENLIEELERENTMVATATNTTKTKSTGTYPAETTEDVPPGKKGLFSCFDFLKNKRGRNKAGQTFSIGTEDEKGWVTNEMKDKKPEAPKFVSVGMVTVLTKQNSGEADAELVKQDLNDIRKLDNNQKKDRDDMLLKMLKVKLRKMKGKGQAGDSFLADFTQKVIDMRKSNKNMLNQEMLDAEEELKKKYPKNPDRVDEGLQNAQLQMDAKQKVQQKDEMEGIRTELLRTSGLTESEVDDIMEKLKQNLAEWERKQGLEQARQARHLAERLEKRRHLLEFRKLQEHQSKEKLADSPKALEEPINKLIEEGKLTEKQKNEILNDYEKNLQNLQKQLDLNALRLQVDLAEKLHKRREGRMKKLEDKHIKEKAMYLEKAEKSTNTDEIVGNYQDLVQRQQIETEETEMELDQTEIQELEKLTQTLEQEKEKSSSDTLDQTVQTIKQTGQLADSDVKRIIKLHDLRMKSLDEKRRDERERMRLQLQEKWQQRMLRLQEQQEREQVEKENIIEQQNAMVRRVLNSNLELTEDAKEKVLREHERNMEALNNHISRSKLKQQMVLEEKLSKRKARLAEIQAKQENLQTQRKPASESEMKKLQESLDAEILQLEKDKRAAEDHLRQQLAQETQALLSQQETELAALIGRLEVGHARRQAVLQKQDKTMRELQEQLENQLDSGRLSSMWADQIIQQHYNQVEEVNNRIQNSRERHEQVINERIQAMKYQKQRELEEQLAQERQEVAMMRKQGGASKASMALSKALFEARQKKAMEELEKEMQIEMERHREQLNSELQTSLEKELEVHKGEFLTQLAAASKMSASQMQELAHNAVQDTGASKTRARALSKNLQADMERARSSLGMMDDDEESDEYRRTTIRRPSSGVEYGRKQQPEKRKKHNILRQSQPPKPRPAFETTTGEKVHGMWSDDDDLL